GIEIHADRSAALDLEVVKRERAEVRDVQAAQRFDRRRERTGQCETRQVGVEVHGDIVVCWIRSVAGCGESSQLSAVRSQAACGDRGPLVATLATGNAGALTGGQRQSVFQIVD